MTGIHYPTPAEHAERLTESLHLALEIADEAARTDIESNCVTHADGGFTWWYGRPVLDARDPYVAKTVERALRYLDLREQVIHHTTVPVLIRFKK